MKNANWQDMHYYREHKKAQAFADTCKSLGLSQSAIVNLCIDIWMESKTVYEEAKISLIKSKALRSNRNKCEKI